MLDQIGLPDGEFAFTEADFNTIAAILRADAGIMLTHSKASLVYARLVKRIRALGMDDFATYCAFVTGDVGAAERKNMIEALTTNITRFFREPHHFDHFKTEVAPELIARAREGARVRIWSAGCSSGEEPYSIALTILSLLPDAAQYDIRILASDINAEMLNIGRRGIYGEAALAPVDPALRARWFIPQPAPSRTRTWAVASPVRDLVAFRELNLVGPWPMTGPFDVIFCRNTVIYFDEEIQVRVWRQMEPLLAPNGVLYIGHSERLSGVEQFTAIGLTTYQKAEAI